MPALYHTKHEKRNGYFRAPSGAPPCPYTHTNGDRGRDKNLL